MENRQIRLLARLEAVKLEAQAAAAAQEGHGALAAALRKCAEEAREVAVQAEQADREECRLCFGHGSLGPQGPCTACDGKGYFTPEPMPWEREELPGCPRETKP